MNQAEDCHSLAAWWEASSLLAVESSKILELFVEAELVWEVLVWEVLL